MSDTNATSASPSFAERLADAVQEAGSPLCVGLDPQRERTPPGQIVAECKRVIELTAPYAAAFKPNSAFFEAAGTNAFELLAEVIAAVPEGKLVILDAKRGDMGPTAEAYAHAVFGVLGADAVTVSPYLGADSVAPFLRDPSRGAIVLCHTSNPGAADLQHLAVAPVTKDRATRAGESAHPGGEPLYLAVARLAPGWSAHANVGLVVGATFPRELAAVRAVAPSTPFLIPGVGAQGGDVGAAVAAGLDADGGGILVSSSRHVFYSDDPARAAGELAAALRSAREGALAERGTAVAGNVRAGNVRAGNVGTA